MTPPTPSPSPSRGPWAYPEMFADPDPWTLAAVPRWSRRLDATVAALLAEADLTLTVTRFDIDQPKLAPHIESAIALRP
ncbi:hypothetical protein GS462_11145 [Rhodococcus hoagii]|nr:hypothetical protein [Prescottella equi]MBM4650968.1 hypothetical protein [Prescottella equi]MBM4686685.1 hypothetical protein [Prescottella equi]